MATKILLQNPSDYEAVKGDILELHFTLLTMSILQAVQIDVIKRYISGQKNFKIIDARSNQGELVVTVECIENPIPLALIIGGVTAVLSGWFIWSSVSKVYKIIGEPAIKQAIPWLSIAIAGIVGIVLVKVFK